MKKLVLIIMTALMAFLTQGCTNEEEQFVHYSDFIKTYSGEKSVYTIEFSGYEGGTVTIELYKDLAPSTYNHMTTKMDAGFYDDYDTRFDACSGDATCEGEVINYYTKVADLENNTVTLGAIGRDDGESETIPGQSNTIVGEFYNNKKYSNRNEATYLYHERGVISHQRETDYDSGMQRFFINRTTNASLDKEYTTFGFVTDGMEIIDAIYNSASGNEPEYTIKIVKIVKVVS